MFNARSLLVFSISFGFLCASCAGAESGTESSNVDEGVSKAAQPIQYGGKFWDWSRQIEIYVKDCGWGDPNHRSEKTCNMDSEYVLVGGGAEVNNDHQGVLYASYPDVPANTWVARSKDHGYSDANQKVRAWAIGMRIVGLDPNTLRTSYMCYGNDDVTGRHPVATATVSSNCSIIGGGAQVDLVGNGQLLVGSYPSGVISIPGKTFRVPTQWTAESKDHGYPVSSTVHAYAIGITNGYIPQLGSSVEVDYEEGLGSSNTGFVSAERWLANEPQWLWVMTDVGGRGEGWSAGRLLTKMKPEITDDGIAGVFAQTKDHQYADYSNTRAYIVAVRKW